MFDTDTDADADTDTGAGGGSGRGWAGPGSPYGAGVALHGVRRPLPPLREGLLFEGGAGLFEGGAGRWG